MKKRQIDVIADILEERGHIDNFYAIETKLTYRLGARIHDLRAAGWEISTQELSTRIRTTGLWRGHVRMAI